MTITLDGVEKPVGQPAVYSSVSPSPDGTLILTRTAHKPYSYLVPVNLFPQLVQVSDLNGTPIKQLADIPLGENIPVGFNAVITGPRSHGWRADQPATVYWTEAQDNGDPKVKADIRDKVMMWAAPFTSTPTVLISLPLRYSGIAWGNDKSAWVYEFWWNDRKTRTYQVDPSNPAKKKTVFDRSSEDAYGDPGDPIFTTSVYGTQVMQINSDNTIFLRGDGASPEGDRPFILQKAGGLQGTFSYIAFAPTRGVAVFIAINQFNFAASMAMAKVANELIATLAPR